MLADTHWLLIGGQDESRPCCIKVGWDMVLELAMALNVCQYSIFLGFQLKEGDLHSFVSVLQVSATPRFLSDVAMLVAVYPSPEHR